MIMPRTERYYPPKDPRIRVTEETRDMEAAHDHAIDRTLLPPQGPTYTPVRRDQRHEAAHEHAKK